MFLRRFLSFKRQIGTLVFADQALGQINPATANLVNAATKLGQGPLSVLVVGTNAKQAALAASAIKGVDKALYCEDACYDHNLPEYVSPLIKTLVASREKTSVLFLQNGIGKNISPRVAALLGVMQVSDVVTIESQNTYKRPAYAGNALITLKSNESIAILTIRPSNFEGAPSQTADESVVEQVESVQVANARIKWVKEDLARSERPDLNSAKRVVSGGRALKSKEHFDELLNPLADALGAAIGASRAAVDAGFANNALQIGQTGQVVAPDLYIALGISGAIQHLAGMKDSKVIAAINKDPDAPIFEIADVGLVADLDQAIPELVTSITTDSKQK